MPENSLLSIGSWLERSTGKIAMEAMNARKSPEACSAQDCFHLDFPSSDRTPFWVASW